MNFVQIMTPATEMALTQGLSVFHLLQENLLKLFFSKTIKHRASVFCANYHQVEHNEVCSNHDPRAHSCAYQFSIDL